LRLAILDLNDSFSSRGTQEDSEPEEPEEGGGGKGRGGKERGADADSILATMKDYEGSERVRVLYRKDRERNRRWERGGGREGAGRVKRYKQTNKTND